MSAYNFGRLVRWIVILGIVVFAIWGAVKIFSHPAVEAPGYQAPVPTEPASPLVIPTEKAPAKVEVEEPVKVPDTVNHFYDLATFYIDGDPDVQGYKVQGQTMKYACKNDFGVFITMDPGVVNGQSTGDLGAVFFVACKKGDIVTLSTPHWSTSALHQQIHLVEFTQEISEKQAAEFLKVLKIDEGKELAFYINLSGEVTKY